MKKSKLLLISGILGSIYLIYLLNHFVGGTITAKNATDGIAGAIATALVSPHMLFVGLFVIFIWISWAMGLRWAVLVSEILYAVSILSMIIYAPFVLIEMVLSFVAFSKMKNVKQQ